MGGGEGVKAVESFYELLQEGWIFFGSIISVVGTPATEIMEPFSV